VFIGISTYMCINIYIYTVFLRKKENEEKELKSCEADRRKSLPVLLMGPVCVVAHMPLQKHILPGRLLRKSVSLLSCRFPLGELVVVLVSVVESL
jgi:hypothetical protein